MIWNLLLAHLLADFPLQPMWLVRSKERTWGLAVHSAVHFLTTLLLVGSARAEVWPQVLALAVFHFTVDVIKYRLNFTRPVWSVVSYFVDQAVHVASLVVLAAWIASVAPQAQGLIGPMAAVYASGYLIATHVWFVTEKTIWQARISYRSEIELTFWPRMLVRAGLLTALLYLGTLALPTARLGVPAASRAWPAAEGGFPRRGRVALLPTIGIPLAAALQLPYHRDRQWRRAVLTDVIVVLATAAWTLLVSSST